MPLAEQTSALVLLALSSQLCLSCVQGREPSCGSECDDASLEFSGPEIPAGSPVSEGYVAPLARGGTMTVGLGWSSRARDLPSSWRAETTGDGLVATALEGHRVSLEAAAEGEYELRIFEDDTGVRIGSTSVVVEEPVRFYTNVDGPAYVFVGGTLHIMAYLESADGEPLAHESMVWSGPIDVEETGWWWGRLTPGTTGPLSVKVSASGLETTITAHGVRRIDGLERHPDDQVYARIPLTGLPLNGIAFECFMATLDGHYVSGVPREYVVSDSVMTWDSGACIFILSRDGKALGPAEIVIKAEGYQSVLKFEFVEPVSPEELEALGLEWLPRN